MSVKIFEKLLIDKIDWFTYQFKNSSKELFYDETKGCIIHPGEYGVYRENICKEYLQYLKPSKYDFGTGFVINVIGDVSTQCDLIIYDPQHTPLIQNNNFQRFFPVETIVAVGEVKSVLSYDRLCEALLKLSKIKSMRESVPNPVIIFRNVSGDYDPRHYHYDQVFSFLICEKFDFKFEGIVNDLDKIYSGIEVTHRHNMVLSIEDGLLLYFDDNNKSMMYPYHRNVRLKNRLVVSKDNKTIYLKMFSSYFFLGTSSTTILYPEMSDYMGSIQGGFNIDESGIISSTKSV